MTHTNIEEKKHFEANMLDGDDIKDCGKAMLSAESVLEYVIERLAQRDLSLKTRLLKELGEQGKKYQMSSGTSVDSPNKYWEGLSEGRNRAFSDITSIINAVFNENQNDH